MSIGSRSQWTPRRGGLAITVMIAAVCVAWLGFATLARSAPAACGGVDSIGPLHPHHGARPPLAIGDSTMLLALGDLAAAGYEANAHGCREFPEALALLRARKARGSLPHMVVLALGADGSITRAEIGETLGLLCCKRLLVLVTPRELGGGSGSDAATVRAEVGRHRNRMLLLDWVHFSRGHGGWFQPDGLHLTTAGAQAFTRLLARALPYAYPKPKPKPKRHKGHIAHTRREGALSQASLGALAITPSLTPTGYVSAKLTGPLGAQVQLSEQGATTTLPIAAITLGAGGAQVTRALSWRCEPRQRRLVAVTLPPAAPQQATAAITTPSCSRRLQTTIARTARVGRSINVRVRDRWGLGALTFSVCLRPPGGAARCRPWRLAAGQAGRTLRLGTPRPGGWIVDVHFSGGARGRSTVWAAHPNRRIRLLAAGDSEMQEVDDFVAQDLGGNRVDVTKDARISTGLTNSFFFNWQAHASRQAASLRPDVTVMFIGGNEGFPIADSHGRAIACCSPAWSAGYAGLVARMMQAYMRGGAGRVYWFLLPTPRARHFQSLFHALNSGIRAAATRFPGRAALIDANAFFTPHDRYRDFMVYRGHGFVIHASDGIHLSTTANQVAASLIVRRLRSDRVIRSG